MRFKVTTYVQVSRTFPGETEQAARCRIWLAMEERLTNLLIGEQLCEDTVTTIPERLTPSENERFPLGLLARKKADLEEVKEAIKARRDQFDVVGERASALGVEPGFALLTEVDGQVVIVDPEEDEPTK